jgi:hypothetical protein
MGADCEGMGNQWQHPGGFDLRNRKVETQKIFLTWVEVSASAISFRCLKEDTRQIAQFLERWMSQLLHDSSQMSQ